jgi:hypothetical protein
MDYYEIFLNSSEALSGSSTPHTTRFNLGTVYDFIPNAYHYQNSEYCFVKVKYFSVEETSSAFNTANISTILIEMSGALPQSVRSNSISVANPKNLTQSNIIGIVPTSASDSTYSSNTFDNDFVKSNNILNGDIEINLKDQDGASLTLTTAKAWVMLLCVAFEKKTELLNYPHTASSNLFSF